MRRFRAALLGLAFAAPAAAERLVADVSQNRIAITAGFEGSELFVFGAIARDAPAQEPPPQVIVRIAGPAAPLIVRRKARVAGVWVNSAAERIAAAPSYYAVASTGPLREGLSFTEDLRHRVSLENVLRIIDAESTGAERQAFLDAAVRLRRANGLYDLAPGGVSLEDGVLFRASFALPANIVEGDYAVTVLLTRDGAVIDSVQTEIDVAKAGIERWLYDLARRQPLIYGALAIALALAAGLAASELFRWLRR
jgi:uncharacterized protein (TIGR02186 family)